MDYKTTTSEGIKAMRGLESYVRQCGHEHSLLELVKTRASQISGCAFCLDMHTKDARTQGETEQRLYALSAWHDAPFFTEREQAALAWTEAITRTSRTHTLRTMCMKWRANIFRRKDWWTSHWQSWPLTAGTDCPFPSALRQERISRRNVERRAE